MDAFAVVIEALAGSPETHDAGIQLVRRMVGMVYH